MSLTCWEKITIVIVAAVGLRILVKLTSVLWRKLIAPGLGLGLNVASQGRWAVVTGATDGIGKAYAEALASRGLDVLLVSRSQDKLDQVAIEIKQRFGVEVRTLEADLTQGQTVYSKIATSVEELEVGILVNNAGTSYDHPEVFTSVSEETIARVLQLNVAGVTGVARAVLPGMMERRKGVVINVSSTSAAIPNPYLSVYAASKAYVDKLSADLAAEVAPRGITVQCILPGPVATKMSKIRKSTWMAPSPEKFVESALKSLGIESRTTGYFPHSLLVGSIDAMRSVSERASVWLVARTMLNIRNRAVRKKIKDEQTGKVEGIPNRDQQAD